MAFLSSITSNRKVVAVDDVVVDDVVDVVVDDVVDAAAAAATVWK